jgi:hypothetical protein
MEPLPGVHKWCDRRGGFCSLSLSKGQGDRARPSTGSGNENPPCLCDQRRTQPVSCSSSASSSSG